MHIPTSSCFYCGQPDSTTDHVPPLTKRPSAKPNRPQFSVNACPQCNSTLSDHDFSTIESRIAYAQKRALKSGRTINWHNAQLNQELYATYIAPRRTNRARRLPTKVCFICGAKINLGLYCSSKCKSRARSARSREALFSNPQPTAEINQQIINNYKSGRSRSPLGHD